MMGQRQVDQAALFYEFSLERHVPASHLLRSIDRFVDLSSVRSHLAPFYSCTGRPSIDPELLVRMLLVGYCYGIRSERRLCEEVHLNLAYRWFCRLGLDGEVPDHSTFSTPASAAGRADRGRRARQTCASCDPSQTSHADAVAPSPQGVLDQADLATHGQQPCVLELEGLHRRLDDRLVRDVPEVAADLAQAATRGQLLGLDVQHGEPGEDHDVPTQPGEAAVVGRAQVEQPAGRVTSQSGASGGRTCRGQPGGATPR